MTAISKCARLVILPPKNKEKDRWDGIGWDCGV